MSLDPTNQCGIAPFNLSPKFWLTGICSWHDERFVRQDKSFIQTSTEFWTHLKTRSKQLDKPIVVAATFWTVGTVVGAPIWFGRFMFRKIKGN